jgi:HipA-like C-terminal domain
VRPFRVWDVSSWSVVRAETLGRDRKVWLRHPAVAANSPSREGDWLFKPVVVPAHGVPQGEDWAEKVVSELGRLLGVPCADVDLAVRVGEAGLVSRNVVPDGWDRVLGAELMGTVVPNYQEGRNNPRGRPGHSPELIARALAACHPAPGYEHLGATGTFAGYLVLDAWVANQDRHDQNWAVMARSGSQELRLAPSYDHASSLAFSRFDSYRERVLRSGGMRAFAERGRASRFEHDPDRPSREIPTLVDVAHRSLDLAGPEVRRHWLTRLHAVEQAAVEEVVHRTPNMSEVGATFVMELLNINRRRLLDDR